MTAEPIRVDFSNVAAQVARLRDLCSDLSRLLGDLDSVRQGVSRGWNDPASHVYQSALGRLQGELRREIDEIGELPGRFTGWVRQWQAAVEQAVKDAANLPD